MLIRIIFGLMLILVIFMLPGVVQARGEFLTSYDVSYDVDVSGVTQVTEDITFKNQTEKYYPYNFSLVIGATDIFDVSAKDTAGDLPVTFTDQGKKTLIKVDFSNLQVVGKGKEYKWTLRFKSRDFSQQTGKSWQVSVPKVNDTGEIGVYNLKLSVPVDFGDSTAIEPVPEKTSETAGRINYFYNKEQLTSSGVSAFFGSDQLVKFRVNYQISNNGFLPSLFQVPLPGDTAYQQVVLNKLFPKPENVTVDDEGNNIAWFRLGRNEGLQVGVEGLAKLTIVPNKALNQISKDEYQKYTANLRFWEKDNPLIKTKLQEIFKNQKPETNTEKARLIQRFVSSYLQFDELRIKAERERLGALTALANPDRALAAEYTDLFIALARAANVPAREVVGFGYASNRDLRPLSLNNGAAHVWPEYFEVNKGWVMVDPTWESTSGGVDYFSKLDLSHFTIAHFNNPSQKSYISSVDFELTDEEIKRSSDLRASLNVPTQIYAAFPAYGNIKIENTGNSTHPVVITSLSSGQINISEKKPFITPVIPPFGSLEYPINLRAGYIWESFEDVLILKVDNQDVQKKILIKPIFGYRWFVGVSVGLVIVMFLIYGSILFGHIKISRKKKE